VNDWDCCSFIWAGQEQWSGRTGTEDVVWNKALLNQDPDLPLLRILLVTGFNESPMIWNNREEKE
jgi:hypothetical protein